MAKTTNIKGKREAIRLLFITLFVFTLILPVIFAWIVEISMEFSENVILTNGFTYSSPIKIYHYALWGTMITHFLFGIWFIHKIFKREIL